MVNKVTDNYSLFVQKIDTVLSELEKNVTLTTEEQERYKIFKNDKRKIEWLGVRNLLQTLHNKNSFITYNSNGKPQLNTGEQISISHSYGVVGLLISNNLHIGLDIERKRDKIERIKHKFLSKKELNFIDTCNDKTEMLTIFWSSKEALLKIYGKTDLIFEEELSVQYNNSEIIGEIKTQDYYLIAKLNKIIIDNYVIIWSFN